MDKWRKIKEIGKGGQANIFLVKSNDEDENIYAQKCFKNKNRINRLKNEIISIQKLDHKNIIKIIDYDLKSSVPYYVTKYYPEGHLTKIFINKLNLSEKLDLAINICKAIQYAHNNKVIHRDLKPSNILLDKNNPIIADFGLTYLNGDDIRETKSFERIGSFYYMAPEFEDGKQEVINYSVDIYSLGKIIYWIFSNGTIFNREKIFDEKYILLNFFDNYIFAIRIMILCFYATHKDVSTRYSNINDFISDLEYSKIFLSEKEYFKNENRINNYIPKNDIEKKFIIALNFLVDCDCYRLDSEIYTFLYNEVNYLSDKIFRENPQSDICKLDEAFTYFNVLAEYYQAIDKVYGWNSESITDYYEDYNSFISECEVILGEINREEI